MHELVSGRKSVATLLLLVAATSACVALNHKLSESLVVGWNDEFNSPTNWKSFPAPHAPDVSVPEKGALRLRVGKKALIDGAPFQWASLSRNVEVDVSRYPILAVYARNLRGPAWWDVIVQGKTEERLVGQEIKSPSLDHPGLILFDLTAPSIKGLELRPVAGTDRPGDAKESTSARPVSLRVRINIAGTKEGCSVEYCWLRFVRREDAERLAKDPRIQEIVVEP